MNVVIRSGLLAALLLVAAGIAPTGQVSAATAISTEKTIGTRHALLIGLNYTWSDLPDISYAHHSVYKFGKELESYGFSNPHLLIGKAATKASITEVLQTLIDVCDDNDELLVFFVGHGVRRKDQDGQRVHALLAADDAQGRATDEFILTRDIVRVLQSGHARNTAFILGTCHAGQVIRDVARFEKSAGPSEWDHRSMSLFAASSPLQLAFGNESETLGYYAEALIDGLHELSPHASDETDAGDLHVHAQRYLHTKTSGQQRPQYHRLGSESFRFVREFAESSSP